jgi:hypothetical protein
VNVSPADSGVIQICDKYVPTAYPDTKNFVLENEKDDSPVMRGCVTVFRAIPSPGYSFDHWEGFLNGVAPVISHRLSESDDGETATAVFYKKITEIYFNDTQVFHDRNTDPGVIDMSILNLVSPK